MKSKNLFRAISLLVLFASFLPSNNAGALAPAVAPPLDLFQLPWEQGSAWMAIDGIDNGSKRPASSSHNYSLGGAIDFAPRRNMVTGENTSNFWVTAAAAGVVVESSSCHLSLAHDGGWITQYQFLGNIQVKLGDAVSRNQRLAIIADGVKYKYCPGFQEINIPHLHFMLRPTIVDATFAGWEVKYNSLFNTTTFRKGQTALGLFNLLSNVPDSQPTPTPTAQPTSTPGTTPSPTPTPSGPSVSIALDSPSISVGETALATANLNGVPAEGYASSEFTCTYNASLVDINSIVIADLFGADTVTAINGPQNGSFIVAIAGSQGNKATAGGAAFTFNATALQAGQTTLECNTRVSQGDNVLTQIGSISASLTVLGSDPTPTFTATSVEPPTPTFTPSPFPVPDTPTVPSTACDKADFISNITIPTGTLLQPGAQFVKTWRVQNVGTCDWTTSYQLVFFSGEQMSAPAFIPLSTNVAVGETVDISLNMTAPSVPGSYQGDWMFRNASGTLFGSGPQANQPLAVDITVSTSTATPSVTPVPPASDWLTFANSTYAFEFKYPKEGQIVGGNTDNYARLNLPFVQGTNLSEKYLEVIVVEDVDNCRSPLATSSMLETSEMLVINGISFLKETGSDGTAGHINKWTAYSTRRDNVCVSLDFVLRAANPGVFPTPPPLYDEAAESAVFAQVVSTYAWLTSSATATPTSTSVPGSSPTPTATLTGLPSPTSTPGSSGILTGQVLASQPVTVSLYDAMNTLITSVTVNTDGTFSLTAPAGAYTVSAAAGGFLGAQGSVTLTAGNTNTLPVIGLLAGDIDGNGVIDQFDALTIGMSYNTTLPTAANLNNDEVINVLDLELLAGNYRKTGPVVWQ